MKNISKRILFSVIFGVFGLTSFLSPVTAFAARNASVEISPTESFTNQNLTYIYKITNTNDGTTTAGIGSIEIQIPDGFSVSLISILSISEGKNWELSSEGNYIDGFDSSNNKIGIQAISADDKLANTEFIEISINTTASSIANTYEFTGFVWANIGFSGSPIFTIASQPTIEVSEEVVQDPIPTVNFIIRNGEDLIWNGEVDLPDEGSVSISDVNNNTHDVNARSVLAIFKNIDEENEDFEITDLQYYDSFSSFYLRCITPLDGDELCDNWQYAVGSTTPFTSIDTTELSGGETIGIYFGYPHQVVFSTTSLNTGESLLATTQKYNYENNIWNVLTGVSVGVTLPDPENPWSPIVVSAHEVDESGVVSITFDEATTYYLGIVEDFYFPSYTIVVSNPSSGGGGGSDDTSFDIPIAIAYLKNLQNENGSFENSTLYSDWVAIAYGSYGVSGSAHTNIISYMKSENSISSLLTDNERRAMAILSLGENPSNFDGVNYIDAILGEFDGSQFGSNSLVNDDIFAILPLSKVGYGVNDEEITKSIDFIISKQKENGSWENSIDITAAAIQALYQFKNYGNTESAIENASTYIKDLQQSDGGFGSAYASAWVLQAMREVGESWTKNGITIENYFTNLQEEDGGVLPTSDTQANRIWATAYAIPAMMGNSWVDIMQSVSKPNTLNEKNRTIDGDINTKENINVSENNEKVWTEEEILEIANKILNQNQNVVFASVNQSDFNQNNNLDKEKNIEEIENDLLSDNLSASAGDTGKNSTIPVITVSLLSVSLLVFLVRRFLV